MDLTKEFPKQNKMTDLLSNAGRECGEQVYYGKMENERIQNSQVEYHE